MQNRIFILSLIFIFSAGLFAGDAGDRKKSNGKSAATGKTNTSGDLNIEGAAAGGISFVNANGDTLMQVREDGQVIIGAAVANGNAVLDVDALNDDKGIMLPRLTRAGRFSMNLTPADEGLLIYEETSSLFWYWKGSQWEVVGNGGDNLGDHIVRRMLNLNGFALSGDGDSQDLFIDDDGKVGIGTTTPSKRFHVDDGDVLISRTVTNSSDASLTIEGRRSAGVLPAASLYFENSDADDSNTRYTAAAIRSHNSGDSDDGDLQFFTTSDRAFAERMRITADGNVGIGTPAPGSELEVEGTITATEIAANQITVEQNVNGGTLLELNISGGRFWAFQKEDRDLRLRNISPGNRRFYIDTNTETAFRNADGTATGVSIAHGSGTVTATAFVGDGSGLTGIIQDDLGSHTATQALNLANNNITNGDTITANVFVGDGAGLTGIIQDDLGNHTATQALDLANNNITNGDTITANVFVGDGSGLTGIIYDDLGNHTATQALDLANNNITNGDTITANVFVGDGAGLTGLPASPWLLNGSATYFNGGKVGIGTAAPSHSLNVLSGDALLNSTTVDVSELALVTRNATNVSGRASGIGFSLSSGASNIGAAIIHEKVGSGGTSVGSLHFATKPSDGQGADIPIQMTISKDGNVGIGTTVPGSKLEVAGTVTATSFVGDGSGLTNMNGWQLTGNTGTDSTVNFIGTTDDQPLFFKANNQTILRMYDGPDSPNIIAGFSGNRFAVGVSGATISGGGNNLTPNSVIGDYGTIGGGLGNTTSNPYATVSGGKENAASAYYATVSGGGQNTASGSLATVSGGQENTASNLYATVSGGEQNTASDRYATVSGGEENIASANNATISGGGQNIANANYTTVGGGEQNTASGESATVPGGYQNTAAGQGSFAAGQHAKIADTHDGTFLFSDHSGFDFNSAAANEFAVRATGGVRFVTGIDGAGNPTQTVGINSNGNVGIGTATPSSPLHIEKTLNSGALVTLTNNGTNGADVLNITSSSTGTTDIVDIQNGAFVVEGNGNVGIGTTAPGHRLHVKGTSIALTEGAQSLSLRTSEANGYVQLDVGGSGHSGDKIYIGDLTNTTNEVIMMGDVGIGTTNPTKAKVEIIGFQGSLISTPYFVVNQNTGFPGGNVPANYSLYASARIAAQELNIYSDARIKNIHGRSDSEQDLNTLMDIEITDYTMIDTVAKGSQSQKKVIAQQVKDVFPQAVSTMTDVVPDIYQLSEIADGWVQLATDLQVGEKVKLIRKDGNDIYAVQAVRDGAFRVDLAENGEVFVYGREVDDFHTVDYEAIAMLNVSATQALYQRLQQQQAAMNAQQKEIAALKEKVAKVDMLENQLAAIMEQLASANAIKSAKLTDKNVAR